MSDWKSIYKDKARHRASIVRDVLADKGLEPILLNKQDSSLHIGYFEVLVAPDHAPKAVKLINEEIRFE